jgi:hypothetical protein
MVASRNTLPQLFSLEVAQAVPRAAAEGVLRVAYAAGEASVASEVGLGRYYRLCDRMIGWSESAPCECVFLNTLTCFRQAHGLGVDGAAIAERPLSTARRVLDPEPLASSPGRGFLDAAPKTLLETRKAAQIATRVSDPWGWTQMLRHGTMTGARAFVAAWASFGGAPAEARATVASMRPA